MNNICNTMASRMYRTILFPEWKHVVVAFHTSIFHTIYKIIMSFIKVVCPIKLFGTFKEFGDLRCIKYFGQNIFCIQKKKKK